MPVFVCIMLILSLTNMGIPLSCNFVGEFFSLLAAVEYNLGLGVLATSGMVWSAAYSLYLYNRISFGAASNYLLYIRDLNRREVLAISPFSNSPFVRFWNISFCTYRPYKEWGYL